MLYQFLINYVQKSITIKVLTSIINYSLIAIGSIIMLQKDVPDINFEVIVIILKDNLQ